MLTVQGADGHVVHISMHGANIVSWVNPDVEALLHVRRDDILDGPEFAPIQ